MAAINFRIFSRSNPTTIYVRFQDGRRFDLEVPTKLSVNPADWSHAKGKPIHTKNRDLSDLNVNLEKLKANLLKHYNDRTDQDVINSQWLKDFIEPNKQTIPTQLTDYVAFYLKDRAKELTNRQVQQANTTKLSVDNYQKHAKKKHYLKDINKDFFAKYTEFLEGDKYNHNTIVKHISVIKTLCYHAETKGIAISPELSQVKNSYEDGDDVWLDFDELEKIEKQLFIDDNLQDARDWLLISCDTGQRISDFMRFNDTMVRYQKNKAGVSKPLIEFTQVKTGKIMTIPLSDKIMAILKKRGGKFPKPQSESKYNLFVKDVCCLAGITKLTEGSLFDKKLKRKVQGIYPKYKLVASHVGRRSFATNYYGIIPTPFLMACTGHTRENSFLRYIRKSDSTMAMGLADYI